MQPPPFNGLGMASYMQLPNFNNGPAQNMMTYQKQQITDMDAQMMILNQVMQQFCMCNLFDN